LSIAAGSGGAASTTEIVTGVAAFAAVTSEEKPSALKRETVIAITFVHREILLIII
jgi:hypothetical protein